MAFRPISNLVGVARLFFWGLQALLVRVIRSLKSDPDLSSAEERVLNALSDLSKPVFSAFAEFPLWTTDVESNSRRYISEIVKLKELTEDFKNLDPVAIGAQFARVRYSFPMDLLPTRAEAIA